MSCLLGPSCLFPFFHWSAHPRPVLCRRLTHTLSPRFFLFTHRPSTTLALASVTRQPCRKSKARPRRVPSRRPTSLLKTSLPSPRTNPPSLPSPPPPPPPLLRLHNHSLQRKASNSGSSSCPSASVYSCLLSNSWVSLRPPPPPFFYLYFTLASLTPSLYLDRRLFLPLSRRSFTTCMETTLCGSARPTRSRPLRCCPRPVVWHR